MNNLWLSIVIPAYNEEKNIRLGALDKVLRYLETVPYQYEVIIVDDGSTDSTRQLLDETAASNKRVRLIVNPHQGKAATVIRGVLSAKGTYVLFTDLDQATPISEIEKIFPWFNKGYDVVIGSRSSKREGAPLLRIFMAKGFMFLRGSLLGIHNIRDTQCGFKAFRRDAVQTICSKLRLYGHQRLVKGSMVTAGFDIEMLFVAKKLGFLIKEVPVEWHYVETRRVNPLKDSWQGFLDIIKIRLNAWQGQYA